ncbi:unnamed protein product [Phyllotreta striolata]|uniref:cysteine--tRNA ligase n=1 Tax=Phyllotreta striolata TaxID=444603 RepID=A0A9N9TJT2_PHYSR|nr:unnamed protein product [Phyllotreta striolata]
MHFKVFSKTYLIKVPQQIRKNHHWLAPTGWDTGIKVHNCITKQKEPLILKNKQFMTWYTCGPTVYDSSHLGHASCYVKLDIIQRILKEYFNINLVTALNITDIDDKIIRRAEELKVSHRELTKKYESEFWTDCQSLGISKPTVVVKVTEHIPLVIKFIEKLLDNNQCYIASDKSVYFDVKTTKNYGKLQNIGEQEEKKEPGHVKKSLLDFALWKSTKAEGEPFWESPWGNGRPGWHIECSALASRIFGSNIDIHAGGIDLRFPHHENEEAQSCAFHGTSQWVNYWLHTGHLHLNQSTKMSKSLKNTVSIQDMLKTHDPHDFRMACVLSRYQNNMEYSDELMSTAKNTLKTFKNCVATCDEFKNGYISSTVDANVLNEHLDKSARNIHDALCDDFDTPSVIKILNELVSVTNSMLYTTASAGNTNGLGSVLAVRNFIDNILGIFGLNVLPEADASKDFSEIVDVLNEFRQAVRCLGIDDKNKNILQLCDNVRDKAKTCGVLFKDRGKLSTWSM